MTQVRAPDIATKEEVLETFTQLMRGEKTAEQMKAADALAKYHGRFVLLSGEQPVVFRRKGGRSAPAPAGSRTGD